MTSEKLKPTPGPWVVEVADSDESWARYFPVITGPDYEVVGTEGMYGDREQDLANARLIAEAGTVFHECGLSPRELLEVVRDIRSLLEQSTAHIKELCMCYSHPLPEATMGEIYDALAKHKEV